jgi:hypothetical protein
VAGRYVGDGAAIDKGVRSLLSSLEGGAGITDLKLAMAEHQGVTFHGLTAHLPPASPAPKTKPAAANGAAAPDAGQAADCAFCEQVAALARGMLGEEVPIVVGTSTDRVYLAVGRDGLALLKECIDTSAARAEDKVPPVRFRAALGPLVAACAQANPEDLLLGTMDRVIQQTGEDQVSLTFEPRANGCALRLDAPEGVLSLIGIYAVTLSRMGGLGGF